MRFGGKPKYDDSADRARAEEAARADQNMAARSQYLNLAPITPNTGGAGSSYIVR